MYDDVSWLIMNNVKCMIVIVWIVIDVENYE